MAANPLEDDPERDHRIRERAYHIWNDEGRPAHREGEFWERARELIGMEDSAGFGQLPNPETTGADPNQSEPVEEASIQDNLGEFPGRFTDQGESKETPASRKAPSGVVRPESVQAKTGKPAEKSPEKLPAKPALKAKAVKTSEPASPSGAEKVGAKKAGAKKADAAKAGAAKKPKGKS